MKSKPQAANRARQQLDDDITSPLPLKRQEQPSLVNRVSASRMPPAQS